MGHSKKVDEGGANASQEGAPGIDFDPISDRRDVHEAEPPMHAYADFRNNFKKGDLLYGFSRARKNYLQELPVDKWVLDKAAPDGSKPQLTYCTIDEYNTHISELPDGDEEDDIKSAPGHFHVDDYRGHLLQHARYSPNLIHPSVPEEDLSPVQQAHIALQGPRLERHRQNLTHHGQDDSPWSNRQYLSFRRSSKFGIEYILSHTDRTIHFVLDRVGRNENAGKLLPPTPEEIQSMLHEDKIERSPYITGSEQRYTFRRWQNLPDEQRQRLRFYLGGKEVPPPWEWDTQQGLWEAYAQRREAKHLPANQ